MKKIKEARIATGLNRATVAELLQMPYRTLEDWEKGLHYPKPYIERLILKELKNLKKDVFKMKKIFAETNAYNVVLFVDDNNKAYVVPDGAFEEPLTLDVAKNTDYSNFADCETAEECQNCQGVGDVIIFNEDEYENIIEF